MDLKYKFYLINKNINKNINNNNLISKKDNNDIIYNENIKDNENIVISIMDRNSWSARTDVIVIINPMLKKLTWIPRDIYILN